jgi:hypothetical protein
MRHDVRRNRHIATDFRFGRDNGGKPLVDRNNFDLFMVKTARKKS